MTSVSTSTPGPRQSHWERSVSGPGWQLAGQQQQQAARDPFNRIVSSVVDAISQGALVRNQLPIDVLEFAGKYQLVCEVLCGSPEHITISQDGSFMQISVDRKPLFAEHDPTTIVHLSEISTGRLMRVIEFPAAAVMDKVGHSSRHNYSAFCG